MIGTTDLQSKTTLILGASANQARYSYRAQQALQRKGIAVYPVHPSTAAILGEAVYPSLQAILDLQINVHTVTVYVRPSILIEMLPELIQLNPERIVFNPGGEDQAIITLLREAGIDVIEACTLVLLSTEQF